jgi:hypothetical protein
MSNEKKTREYLITVQKISTATSPEVVVEATNVPDAIELAIKAASHSFGEDVVTFEAKNIINPRLQKKITPRYATLSKKEAISELLKTCKQLIATSRSYYEQQWNCGHMFCNECKNPLTQAEQVISKVESSKIS